MTEKVALIIFEKKQATPFQKHQWNYRLSTTNNSENISVFYGSIDNKFQALESILTGNEKVDMVEPELSYSHYKKFILVTCDAVPVGDLKSMLMLDTLNYYVKGHTLQTSPVILINSIRFKNWRYFSPQLVFSLHQMLAGKSFFSKAFCLISSFRIKNSDISVVSICGLQDKFENFVFDDDSKVIAFEDGRKMQWDDFHSRGIKSIMQNFFKQVVLYKHK